jgi:hypothetical protein
MEALMALTFLRRWFAGEPPRSTPNPDDAVGADLRAAVSENARVRADSIRCYEARVQSMIAELFLRMGDVHARHDP